MYVYMVFVYSVTIIRLPTSVTQCIKEHEQSSSIIWTKREVTVIAIIMAI